MFLFVIRRRFTFAIMSVLFLAMFLPLNALSGTAFAQTSSPNSGGSSSVILNPNAGSAGTKVTGVGSNWAAGDSMLVQWDDGTNLATTTVQSNDTFTVSFTVPSNATQGAHTVYFTDQAAGYFIPATFTVALNTGTVTVQKVWTGDSNNNSKSSFVPGDTIHYLVQVTNSGSSSVTATFTFLATGPQQIFSWSGPGNVAPGTDNFYSPHTVPTNAPLGTYTLTVTVTYNGVSSSGSQFAVAGILNVPFYSQYEEQPMQNFDCGPTSVAMVLSYYHKGPGGDSNAMIQIRKATGVPSGDTGGPDLERALSHYGSHFNEISRGLSVSTQIQAMEQSISQKQPVIVLIRGVDLGRITNPPYGDHWVVVTGFSYNGQTYYVHLNDPDYRTHKLPPGWINGGPITLDMATFQKAFTDAQSVNSIVVTS